MKLFCEKCSGPVEVEDALPAGGRMVSCPSCGNQFLARPKATQANDFGGEERFTPPEPKGPELLPGILDAPPREREVTPAALARQKIGRTPVAVRTVPRSTFGITPLVPQPLAPPDELDLPGLVDLGEGTEKGPGAIPTVPGLGPPPPGPQAKGPPGAIPTTPGVGPGVVDLPAPRRGPPAARPVAPAPGEVDLPAPKLSPSLGKSPVPASAQGASPLALTSVLGGPPGVEDLPAPKGGMSGLKRPIVPAPVVDLPAPKPAAKAPGAPPAAKAPIAPAPVVDLPAPKLAAKAPIAPAPVVDLPAPKPVAKAPVPPAAPKAPIVPPAVDLPAPKAKAPIVPPVVDLPAPKPAAKAPAAPAAAKAPIVPSAVGLPAPKAKAPIVPPVVDLPAPKGPLVPDLLAPKGPLVPDLLAPKGPLVPDLVAPKGPAVPDLLTPKGPAVPDLLTPKGPAISDLLTPKGPAIPDLLTPKGPAVPDLVTPKGPVIANLLTPKGPAGPDLVTPVGPALPNLLTPKGSAGPDLVTPVGPALPNLLTPKGSAGPDLVTPVGPAIPNLLTPVGPAIPDLLTPTEEADDERTVQGLPILDDIGALGSGPLEPDDFTPLPPPSPGYDGSLPLDFDSGPSKPAPFAPVGVESVPPPAASGGIDLDALLPPMEEPAAPAPVAPAASPPAERPVEKPKKRGRPARMAAFALGAAVGLGGIGAALVKLTPVGEMLGLASPKGGGAVTVARRLIGEDTPASFAKAVQKARDEREADPDSMASLGLEAQAHYAAALLGLSSEQRAGDDAVAKLDAAKDEGAESKKARGLKALSQGKIAEAEPLLRAAGSDGATQTYLGWMHLAAGDAAAAKGDFQRAVAAEPGRAGAHAGLGRALEASGDAAGALAAYKQALKLSPQHFSAAVAVERLGKGDPAGSEQRLLELTKKLGAGAGSRDQAAAWALLGQRSREGGRTAEAEERFRKAMQLDTMSTSAKVGLASVLCDRDKAGEAVPLLDGVLVKQPKNLEALFGLAEADIALKKAGEAAKVLDKVQSLAAKDARAPYLRGRLEEAKGGDDADERAIAKYRDAIALDPRHVDSYVALASLYRKSKPEDALTILAGAEQQAVGDPSMRNKLGEVYLSLGDTTRAGASFRQVLEKAPEFLRARMNLAAVLEQEGKLDEADKALVELEKIQKGFPGLVEKRAELALARKKPEEAAKLFDQAVEEPGARASLLAEAAKLHLSLGHTDRARALYDDLVKADPRSPAAYLGLARLEIGEGHPQNALHAAQRALAMGESGESHLIAGRAMEMLGRPDDARMEYAAAAKGPTEVEGRIGKARLLVKGGAVKDALVELEAANKIEKRSEALSLMGDCYEELSQRDKARHTYEDAVKLDGKNAEAAFKLGRSYRDAGKRRPSIEQLERAVKLAGDKAPFAAEAWLLLGDGHREGKEREAAVAAYKKYLEIAPKGDPTRKDVVEKVAALEGEQMSVIGDRLEKYRRAAEFAATVARVFQRTGLLSAIGPVAGAKFLRDVRARGTKGPYAILHLHALNDPLRPAIVSGDVRLSYGELDERINRLAHGLHRLGVGPGDRVGVLLRNSHEYLELGAANGCLGSTSVQIGYRLKPKEIAYILENSGAKALVFHAAYADVVGEALADVPRLSREACIAVAGPAAEEGGPLPRASGFTSYDEIQRTGDPNEPPRVRGGGYGGLIIYTSGTTGRAKGASRDFKKTGLQTVLNFISEIPLSHNDRHLVTCPLYHSAAPAFVALNFFAGACVVILDHFEPHNVLRVMERERITSSMMVPTMYNRLVSLGLPELRKHDLSSLKWLISGAAPLPTELARRIEESFGPILYNFYGATETGFVSLAKPGEHTARPGTIGKLVRGNKARLLDDQGRDVPEGEVGELYVKNSMLVGGYHGNDEATQAAQREGFFSVGDLARRDGDGYYYLADRKHDMVISGGVNIYPWEIEQRLHQHPAVSEAAVVGVPDPDWGESLAAFIVLRDGRQASAEELQAWVGEELADYKRPRKVLFLDTLPRNPTGKVLKRELKARIAGASDA